MSLVYVRRSEYDAGSVKNIVGEIMDGSGLSSISPGARVLIKPNLLLPAKPSTGILTHPYFVRAATEYVLDHGGRPVVSDSPGMGSLKKVLSVGGFSKELSGLGVDFKDFTETRFVDIGKPFGKIEIAAGALECDYLVNLPKLKTHVMMHMTLGVKNLFGCIVGKRKPEWHFRAGTDREMFAKLLVGIASRLAPAVTIVDGITGLEGQGPGKSGDPVNLGLVVGGADMFAVDRTICGLVGVDPMVVPTVRAAMDAGFDGGTAEISGDLTPAGRIRQPVKGSVVFGPKLFHGVLRRHLVQRPVLTKESCRSCLKCKEICPAKAIEMDPDYPAFDFDACIRCYCCVEICPHAALRVGETLPGRVLRKVLGII